MAEEVSVGMMRLSLNTEHRSEDPGSFKFTLLSFVLFVFVFCMKNLLIYCFVGRI